MDTKQCHTCKRTFLATKEFFNSDKQKKDGLNPNCKSCRSKQRSERRRNNPELREKNRIRASEWYYANQERAREARKRQYYQNREENIRNAREWREQNPERYREVMSKYKKRHYQENKELYNTYTRNRRAKLAGAEGSHTAEDILDLFAEQDGRCAYCDVSIEELFHVDHVVPVSRGGSNDISNLALACQRCNCSKNNRTPDEWTGPI